MQRIPTGGIALLMTALAVGTANAQQTGVDVTLELRARDRSVGQEFRSASVVSGTREGSLQPVKLATGNDIAVCFRATQDGYVTVWSIDSIGALALIYPNPYSHPSKVRGAAVKANTQTCVGEKNDEFKLTVAPPAGKSRVYIYWTRSIGEQIGPEDYSVVGREMHTRGSGYAERSLDYETVGKN